MGWRLIKTISKIWCLLLSRRLSVFLFWVRSRCTAVSRLQVMLLRTLNNRKWERERVENKRERGGIRNITRLGLKSLWVKMHYYPCSAGWKQRRKRVILYHGLTEICIKQIQFLFCILPLYLNLYPTLHYAVSCPWLYEVVSWSCDKSRAELLCVPEWSEHAAR